MRHSFALFSSHLDLAHRLWLQVVEPGSLVIDATCGNGHDTLFLSQIEGIGALYAIDIQQEAIDATLQRLSNAGRSAHLFRQSHALFPKEIALHSVKLIVYNLGYLPGGRKSLTTKVETTLSSLQAAQSLLSPGGGISITAYPGHEEGALEEQHILSTIQSWDRALWSCSHFRWVNRKNSPSLFFIQKSAAINPKI